jgi:hypothetical protein
MLPPVPKAAAPARAYVEGWAGDRATRLSGVGGSARVRVGSGATGRAVPYTLLFTVGAMGSSEVSPPDCSV